MFLSHLTYLVSDSNIHYIYIFVNRFVKNLCFCQKSIFAIEAVREYSFQAHPSLPGAMPGGEN